MSCVQNVLLFRNSPKTFQNSWFVICSGLFLWRIVVQAWCKKGSVCTCVTLFLCIRHDKWSMFYQDCIPFVQCLETFYIVIFIYMLLTFLIIGYTLSENELRIWIVPFFCVTFSREVSCLSTLAQALSPIPTYVVKAWKMNSDVIYHKEPGWCSVSICELLAKVAKILTGVPAEVSRRAMTFKTYTGWPKEYWP